MDQLKEEVKVMSAQLMRQHNASLDSQVRMRNIIFEACLFWFMAQIKERRILHLKRACFALLLIEREEHFI